MNDANLIAHSARASAFTNEILWRLEDDRLLWRDLKSGESGAVSLDDVSDAQIVLEPALRGAPQRLCRLRTRAGLVYSIAAMHRAGLLAREDRTPAWRDFVRALLERVRARNGAARLRHGMSMLAFALALNALALLLIGFVYAVQAFGEALDPDKLERLGRYEAHLDRKFERIFAMLLRLKDLRVGSITA